jgi:polyhydroxyalkanoate synthase
MDKVVWSSADALPRERNGMHLVASPPAAPETPSSAAAYVKTLARTPNLVERGGALAGELAAALVGRSELCPDKGDRRFTDPAWTSNPFYRRLGQAYLALERAISDAVENADVDWPTRERARFVAGILGTGLAPTNTLAGNPAALKHAFDTGGMSLVRGARNLLRDVRLHGGMPRQVDSSPFTVGENLGATPGQVVFRNEVLEVIQYTPSTPNVRSVPLLVVWSVINRHYILDLAKDRSFVEYALGQGMQVFVTSWRNPRPEHGDWNLDTYAQALLDAMDAVREITGSEKIGTVGLCAGGQLLAATMAHLSSTGDDRVAYAGFGVSQLDMSVPNVAGLALHPAVHTVARLGTEATDVVDGRAIAAIFSWLRPNELVWNQWVNNYLMGKDAPQFDILAWNNDTTRVSAALQRNLLDIAVDNLLVTPGALTLLGTPVDLGTITADAYVVGAESDHLVPWRGAYRSTGLFGGDCTFVLSGGGHVQHLVNPPGNPKAHYRTGRVDGQGADGWLAGSTTQQGTWWSHWADWALARSGEERPAPRRLGSTRHRPVEAAPGRYVREQ